LCVGFGLFKTLPHSLITHVHQRPGSFSPSHVPCEGKRVLKRQKRERTAFFPRCHLLLVLFAKCPEFGKKKKNLSRYHRSWEGKKQESKTASSLFRFSKSNKPKRKQTGRCPEAQGLVVVGSKSPKSRRAKRIPFPSVRPKQSRNLTPVLLDDQRMQSSLLCW